MAFPVAFVDERGVLRRYRWPEYPVDLFLAPDEPVQWSITSNPVMPSARSFKRVVIYCGPPAPLPASRWTADEWCEAVYEWLSR